MGLTNSNQRMSMGEKLITTKMTQWDVNDVQWWIKQDQDQFAFMASDFKRDQIDGQKLLALEAKHLKKYVKGRSHIIAEFIKQRDAMQFQTQHFGDELKEQIERKQQKAEKEKKAKQSSLWNFIGK